MNCSSIYNLFWCNAGPDKAENNEETYKAQAEPKLQKGNKRVKDYLNQSKRVQASDNPHS